MIKIKFKVDSDLIKKSNKELFIKTIFSFKIIAIFVFLLFYIFIFSLIITKSVIIKDGKIDINFFSIVLSILLTIFALCWFALVMFIKNKILVNKIIKLNTNKIVEMGINNKFFESSDNLGNKNKILWHNMEYWFETKNFFFIKPKLGNLRILIPKNVKNVEKLKLILSKALKKK